MSDDLISRKALLEEINNFSMRITGSANAMAVMIMEETKKSVAKIVDEQPVAFDLESVIGQIKNVPTKIIETYSNGYPVEEDFISVYDVMKILKSAANTINEKNGG